MIQEKEHPINSKRWMDAYPTPSKRSNCPLAEISVRDLSMVLDSEAKSGRDFIIVDVRRTDCLVSLSLCLREAIFGPYR